MDYTSTPICATAAPLVRIGPLVFQAIHNRGDVQPTCGPSHQTKLGHLDLLSRLIALHSNKPSGVARSVADVLVDPALEFFDLRSE